MSRKLSLLILTATVIAIGVLFIRVVRPFFFPLFFAGVLAVLFRPLYVWAKRIMFGRGRLAAAVVSVGVLVVVLLPVGGVLTLAGVQLVEAGRQFVATVDLPENTAQAEELVQLEQHPQLAEAFEWVRSRLTPDTVKRIREFTANALLGVTQALYERTSALAGDLITFLIGLIMMFLALYYFLADGKTLLAEAHRLSPLDDGDEQELLTQFEDICRGVVLGTVFSALVQGALAGLGFALLGIERIWLLAVFTMFSSFIPFLGAAAVWVCVAVGLVFEQRYGSALFLVIYGTVVISGSDNLIKTYVLHSRAQMHPLVALVTVLGALHLVGLWGIFIGPISAAFFYALLNILHRRLVEANREDVSGEQRVSAPGGTT